jgi:MoxR-like ATPase
MNKDIREINERIKRESAFVVDILAEMDKVIVGQRTMLERLLIGLLANGHILIEGVPGLAKTLMVKTLAATLRTKFQRIQFTPDLLPADITGTLIFDQKKQEFIPKQGPIFANLILADEINRAPAKVQSALLEAMQERQVTIGDTTYPLDEPFLVFATQNPIEQEGTYPLPEAQIDRFMLKVKIDYPNQEEELAIVRRHARPKPILVEPRATPQQILAARQLLGEVYMDEKIEQYLVNLVLATRRPADYGLADLQPHIQYGASPRASLALAQAARAHAFLKRRGYVAPEDVQAVALDVLRHRLILTYEAEAEDIVPEAIIQRILEKVEIP